MSNIIDDVANYLASNGIGTLGVNIFEGFLPQGVDQAVAVIKTGGDRPNIDLPVEHPSFQILIRNIEYDTGEAVFNKIRDLLHNQYNMQFQNGSSIYFYYCRLRADGGFIGKDAKGRDSWSMNFECETRGTKAI